MKFARCIFANEFLSYFSEGGSVKHSNRCSTSIQPALGTYLVVSLTNPAWVSQSDGADGRSGVDSLRSGAESPRHHQLHVVLICNDLKDPPTAVTFLLKLDVPWPHLHVAAVQSGMARVQG